MHDSGHARTAAGPNADLPEPISLDGSSEAILRRLLLASPDCIKVLDLNGNLLFMSENGRRALEINDLTPYMGTCWSSWWKGANRVAAERAVAEAIAGGTGRLEADAPTEKGTLKSWDITITPVLASDGKPEFLLSVARDITAQVAARNAASEQLDRLRSVIESAKDYAVISVDADGKIDGWNTGAHDIFGWSESLAIGQPFDLIWTENDRAAGSPARELKIATDQGMCPDNRWHERSDGRRIFVVGACRPVHNATGELRGFVKVCRDQTEAREKEDAFEDARRRSDASLLAGEIGTFNWDIAADRMYGDANFARLFGLTRNDDGAYPLADFLAAIHPDDRMATAEKIERTVAEGAAFEAEYRIVNPDTSERWVVARGGIKRDLTGRAIHFPGVIVDITARKLADAELAFQRHQLELIFRESPAAMALWRGDDLIFERVNPGYQNLFPGRPLVGLTLLEALPELRGQGFDDMLRHVMQTGEPVVGRETLVRLARTVGGPVEDWYFDFSYLQVRDPDGNPWGVYDHAADVTDRVVARQSLERSQNELRRALSDREQLLESERAARAEAEQAGKMKDEFLATLSHELRTPLNAIVGWTQILKGEPNLSEDLAEGLAVIDRNARAQTQIIEDILDMSRVVSGKLRLDVQQVDLAAVVRAGVETVQPAADAKGVRLQLLLDPAAGPVTGDPGRLHQVFWNLLSNAVKFTPRGGRVQVILERVHSHVEVSVSDTGEGIAREFLPHVFDRFRQADASTTRRHGGLGLGVAIVKQLVELHGGVVRVSSPGLGQGATFRVELPLIAMHGVQHSVKASVGQSGNRQEAQSGQEIREHPTVAVPWDTHRLACEQLAGLTIVAVDDEADAVGLVARLLGDCGAVVRTAVSAADALNLIRAEVPAVLISDIGMPGEDGYSLIKQVRALPPEQGGRVHALALTAYAHSADRIKALAAGFQMHLAKPVEPAELIVTVAALARLDG